MARPGGNPDIADYGYQRQHTWPESCTVQKTIKLPPRMAQALNDGHLPEWREVCRRAIASHLPADIAKELNWPPKEEASND